MRDPNARRRDYLLEMRMGARVGPIELVMWLGATSVGCDTDVWSEQRQVQLSSSVLHPSGTFVSGEIVLEQSRVCLSFDGYRTSTDDPPQFENTDDDLRACYEEQIHGPATFDDEGCAFLHEAGIVDWELTRRSCDLEGEFGDDRIRFDVVPLANVRAVFDYAVPLPREILGLEVVREAPDRLPAGLIAAPGEPIFVIEDIASAIRTQVILGEDLHTVWVTDPVVTGSTLAGSPSFPERDDPSLSLQFEGRAGDVFGVRLELPAGELELGEVHVVSRADIDSLTLLPEVVRVGEGDELFWVAAVAVARDAQGRVLREPPVQWSVIEGDYELFIPDGDRDGTPGPSPTASIENFCREASAGERRSATLEGQVDHFRERVTVQWQCLDSHVEGCACTHSPTRPASWLLAIVVLGLVRRRPIVSDSDP
jgi:MYXO-CTERM domain-containing protein